VTLETDGTQVAIQNAGLPFHKGDDETGNTKGLWTAKKAIP
jgi:hypothetical protein